jgi:hypothetical protein
MTTRAERDCTRPKGFIAFSVIFMPPLNMLSYRRWVFGQAVGQSWVWISVEHEYKDLATPSTATEQMLDFIH